MLRSCCCAGSAGMRNMSFQYQHHQHEVRHIRLNTTTTFFLFESKEKKLHLSDFSVNKLKGKFEIIYPQLTSPVYIFVCHLWVPLSSACTQHTKDQRVTSIHSFRTGSQGTSIRQEFFYTPVCGAGLPKPGDTSSRNILVCLALRMGPSSPCSAVCPLSTERLQPRVGASLKLLPPPFRQTMSNGQTLPFNSHWGAHITATATHATCHSNSRQFH